MKTSARDIKKTAPPVYKYPLPQPGQSVFVVSHGRYGNAPKGTLVEVESIGRTWATLKSTRFPRMSLISWNIDAGGTSVAVAYPNEEIYRAIERKEKLWESLRGFIRERHVPPENIPSDALEIALRALGQTVPTTGA